MHSIKTAILASTAWIIGAIAQSAIVVNGCDFDIYVLSSPSNGGASTPVETIAPGENFTEAYSSGSAVKISDSSTLVGPLTFEYTPNQNAGLVYYDLSDNAGNPFTGYHNTLVPSNSSCYTFDCQSGSSGAACYSNGNNIQVKACYITDLTTTICVHS